MFNFNLNKQMYLRKRRKQNTWFKPTKCWVFSWIFCSSL